MYKQEFEVIQIPVFLMSQIKLYLQKIQKNDCISRNISI